MEERLMFKGHLHGEIRDKVTGKVLESWEADNTICADGKVLASKLLNGVDSTYFRAIAIGTDTPGASALGVEVARSLATLTYLAPAKAVFEHTFTFGTAESYAITEAGVFNNSVSGGTMFDSFSFSAKNVDIGTDLYVKITVTCSS